MTLEQFLLWEAGIGVPLLVAFGVWLVTQNTKRQVEIADLKTKMAEQAAKFVTWEHMRKVDEWRAETQREFKEIREQLHNVALDIARIDGPKPASHRGG
jgi:glutamyl-tRNA reductase